MPLWVQAGLWGLFGGGALVLGAAVAYFVTLPKRAVATVMALGSGVLISAVSFELMDEAFRNGGFVAAAVGFVGGAALYTAANLYISRHGARHRKRSGSHSLERQPDASEGGGLAIAAGALLDGVPESVAIGVSVATVAAVFLSNVPEGLASVAGMRKAGRSASYIFGVWGGIALACGLAALLGNVALAGAPPSVGAITSAVAAGAILAMIADTMIPEAFEQTHEYAGLITVLGFLAAFALTKLGGD
jgi:ZIP family zinc transporter